ncbi:RGCVC family protein [Nocardia transvalensis]|nr:RGCVC family protein [Nocardia transvalensis]
MPAAPLEFSCAACPHTWEAHDRIGIRYCSATTTRGLDRKCACTCPADHEKTYYR